MFADKE
ncbi:hypothetical protein D030_1810B, partial [Vibrio parahaemolyticus AQ3810]